MEVPADCNPKKRIRTTTTMPQSIHKAALAKGDVARVANFLEM